MVDPAYLADLVTAVNAATAPWRVRACRSVAQVDAEYRARREAIDRRHPMYWGAEGVGALICAFEALVNRRQSLDRPEWLAATGLVADVAFDAVGCLDAGLPALLALSQKLEAALESPSGRGPGPGEALAAVAELRQLFVSSLLAPAWAAARALRGVFAAVHDAIAREFRLDRQRRRAHHAAARQRHLLEWGLAGLGELAVKHRLGRATVTGGCELVGLVPSAEVDSRAKLLALVNAAFEQAYEARAHTGLCMHGWDDDDDDDAIEAGRAGA